MQQYSILSISKAYSKRKDATLRFGEEPEITLIYQ